MEKKADPSVVQNETKQPSGFLSWIAGILSGGNDPLRDKRRQLKQVAKDLSKVKYRFYRIKGNQAAPGLAKFFYEIYKNTANAAVIIQGAEKSQTLKNIAIEYFFSEDQRALLERLSEESIRERAKTIDPKTLSAALKDDLVTFFSSLDSTKIQHINATWTLIHRFLRFIAFDYYFVLKKFDSSLMERSFTSTPKFETINAEYIADDIKDYQEVSLMLSRDDEWDEVLSVLKAWKGLDVVDRAEWLRVVGFASSVNASDTLTLIVKQTTQDPYYKPVVVASAPHIVEPYMEKLRTQVESTMQKLSFERRDAQIEKLTQVVFGTKDIQRTKYYNEKSNLMFSKKLPNGYEYTAPINILKAFLLDYFKKDIRELQELILVRGKWSTNVLSQQMSDTYYQILVLSEQLIAFDEGLADDKEAGMKVRKAMGRVVDRDSSTGTQLRQILADINEQALKLINDSAGHLISFGKNLKMVLEDMDKKDHEIIINWKELEPLSEVPLKGRISDVYRKLYYFIQLLQIYLKGGGKTSPTPQAEDLPV